MKLAWSVESPETAWELEQGVEYAGAYEDKPAVLKRASEPDP